LRNQVVRDATIRDFLKIIYKHRIIIIAIVLIAICTVLINLELKTPKYSASVKILISGRKTTEADYYKELNVTFMSLLVSETNIITSSRVLERVVNALKLYQIPLDYEKQFASRIKRALIEYRSKSINKRLQEMPPEERHAFLVEQAIQRLRGSISINPIENSMILIVTVSDYTPEGAARIVNSLSRSYVIYDLEQQIKEIYLKYGEKHTLVQQLKGYIKEIEKTLHGRPIPPLEARGPASAKIIEQAYPSKASFRGVNKVRPILGVFVVSLVLGILFAIVLEFLDYTIKSPQEIVRYLDVPFLGSIPERKSGDKFLITDINPSDTDYTRAIEDLSVHLHELMLYNKYKSILFLDTDGSMENTIVIANFGIYLSHKIHEKLLIIDANLRSPRMAGIFNISNERGLVDILEGKISFEDVICDVGSNLSILPAGRTQMSPVSLLNSPAMSELIKNAREKYNFVFVTCVDIKSFPDASILALSIDGSVLIISEGKIRRQVIKNAIAPMEVKHVNIIGAILNNRTYILPQIIYKIT
jgi:capsular exopolysaccharide synthesis family protein